MEPRRSRPRVSHATGSGGVVEDGDADGRSRRDRPRETTPHACDPRLFRIRRQHSRGSTSAGPLRPIRRTAGRWTWGRSRPPAGWSGGASTTAGPSSFTWTAASRKGSRTGASATSAVPTPSRTRRARALRCWQSGDPAHSAGSHSPSRWNSQRRFRTTRTIGIDRPVNLPPDDPLLQNDASITQAAGSTGGLLLPDRTGRRLVGRA